MTQMLPLGEQLKNLERLQEVDLQIDNLKKNQNSLPAVLKTLDESLGKLHTEGEAKKNALGEIEKVQKQTRAALDLNRDRLARSNTRIESVQNSQEFQAINKEIDQLKKLNGSLEEQLKKSDFEAEGIRKEVGEISTKVEGLQSERATQAAQVSGQTNKLESEISTLSSQRAQFSSSVEARILNQYNRIRSARGGLGVVPAVNGRCKGCNMMVPPQLYNELRKAIELHTCPSCHRILFAPQEQATPAASEDT